MWRRRGSTGFSMTSNVGPWGKERPRRTHTVILTQKRPALCTTNVCMCESGCTRTCKCVCVSENLLLTTLHENKASVHYRRYKITDTHTETTKKNPTFVNTFVWQIKNKKKATTGTVS